MKDNQAKYPQLRFKGFTDPWEQRKLGKIGKTFTGLSGKTKEDFGHGDAKFVTYMNVFSNPVSDLEMIDNIEVDAKQNSVEYGDVFFTTSSETPEEVGMSSVWLGNKDNVYLNSFSFGYRPDKIFAPYYLAFMLRSPVIRRKFMFLAQGISRYNISKTKVMNMEVPVPKLEEQKQIGDFFQQLDNLITLHQRKLVKLKKLKQGYLQKLFPKNGSKFPQLRFSGFADAWEQRKLGEETTISAGGDIDKEKIFDNGKYPVYANALTNNGIVGYYEDTYRIEAPAVTVTGRGDVGHAQARKVNFTPVVRLLAVKSKHDVDFLENAINNHAVLIESTGVPQLTSPQLGNYKIYFPSFEEQQKIGSFFKQIDDTIALHQRKLDLLKEQKKGFLQKMFC